jgi:hypothetical protein
MYTIIAQCPARTDIDEAFVWYEEKQIGLDLD